MANDPEGTALLATMPFFGMLLLFVLLQPRLVMATATTCQDRVCAWLVDPIVGVGEEATVDVAVYRGLAAGLDTVVFKAGDVRIFRQGSGRHWGNTMRQGTAPSAGSDETTAVFTVPADHVPGEPFEVRIQAAWRAAQVADAPGTFDNEGGVATLLVNIDVLSASAA